MDTAAFIVSIMAALIAAGSMWYARGQRLAADKSAVEAARSADAAEAALELQRASERRAEEAAERDRVVWEVERVGTTTFLLNNRGTQPAYDVRVDLADLRVSGGGAEHFAKFDDGHAEQYILARSVASTTNSIIVTWHQDPTLGDEPKRRSLPIVF